MKRIILMMALCLLLPAMALAVTEGVVEPAPQVEIELPDSGDRLFGMWEQGLADIEQAARQVLEQRLHCTQDMTLAFIEAGGSAYWGPQRQNNWQDEALQTNIYVIFLFEDERMGGSMSAQVGFDFETGKLNQCRIGRWYDTDTDEHILDTQGPSGLNAEQERAILDDYLSNVLGYEEYEIINAYSARLPDGGRLNAYIGRKSHKVIRLSWEMAGEEATVQ